MELNRTVLEAASWRLASELVRRHPQLRILRTHPGGGMYDVLVILASEDDSGFRIDLNRNGRIHILGSASGRTGADQEPVEWSDYLCSDPRDFLVRLERAAGLTSPPNVPSSTPRSLTYRVLAAVAATGFMTVHPIVIASGYIDSSGSGGSYRNPDLDVFDVLPAELRQPAADDLHGVPEYRFWIVERDGAPRVVVEQGSASAWCLHRSDELDLVQEYRAASRDVSRVAAKLLAFADDA